MVQPCSRLWFRQAARGIGRRGHIRPYGDRTHVTSAGAATGSETKSAYRTEREGPDRSRAAPTRRVGLAAAALVALIACSPQAPAQNAPSESVDPRAQSGLHEIPLTIRSKSGVHHFTVEIAATPDQQEPGLM